MSFARLVDRLRPLGSKQEMSKEHDPVRLATAAILLEIAHADGEFTPVERGEMTGFLAQSFSLDDSCAHDLLAAADELRARTIDHFALTNFIRKSSSLQQRIDIVKAMWRLVYADGRMTDYENYLVRKLADLLGLEHRVMIDAKVAVLEELGRTA